MPRSAITTGVLFATLAAVAFGVTTPIVAWAGADAGPVTTAALLYAGAALGALLLQLVVRRRDSPVRRGDAARLIAIALAGGAIAPSLLAWGLQRAGATAGALLLNLEAVFTVLLARALFHETIGRHVKLAIVCMVAGGVVLTFARTAGASIGIIGIVAVAGATAAWALDNALTRPLADRNPFQVIFAKGALGATMTTLVAFARSEALPNGDHVAALVACGATGYGASLYLYLLAQRRIGAARTGSVFALAPFIGAVLGWVLEGRHAGLSAVAAAVLFAIGVYLHLTERHAHRHVHAPLEHDHVHTHDDGHHSHVHDPPFVGEHAHPHVHERLEHEHEHAPDTHHTHEH